MQDLLAGGVMPLILGASAGVVASFLNTAASSGSAVSLPMLMAIGLTPIAANATNRVPLLIGALAATWTFWRDGDIDWALAWRVTLPVTLGALAGAYFAEMVPGRDLAIIITAAVLVALVLLFTELKQAIENAPPGRARVGPREMLLFLFVGGWIGFIVLDGATYMLLALVLVARLPLVQANAIKTLVLIPTTLVALAVFAMAHDVDWGIGAVMSIGSIAGGYLGARFAVSPRAKRWIFWMLVVVLGGELVHLSLHYVFHTI